MSKASETKLEDHLRIVDAERATRPAEALMFDEIVRLRTVLDEIDFDDVRRQERARLADWLVASGDELRAAMPDGLTVEFVAFLLKLDHA